MELECEYCGDSFASRKSLAFHQKTSKKCLLGRNEKCDSYSCDECNKTFASRDNLNRHRKTCKSILIKLNVEERINEKDKIIKRLRKELLAKDLELKDQYTSRDLEEIRADEVNAEMSTLTFELDTIKQAYAKLEMELEKTKEMVAFYKKNASVATSRLAPRSRLEDVKTSSSFFCKTNGVLSRLVSEYNFKNGLIGLIDFIKPMIQEKKVRCYVRTDPTRLHYHKFDGKTWVKDRNGLFLRKILNIMKPHVKQSYEDLNVDSKNFTKYDATELDKMQKEIIDLFPVVMGIIHSDGKERKVLVDDIAAKLKHITDI
jgi:hypothetical protein